MTRQTALRLLVRALVLATLVAVAYGPTVDHGFVWDDHEQIVDNDLLLSWSSLGEFFHADVLSLSRGGAERSNYYRPLFFAQLLVYRQAFGLDGRAWHLAAVLWHLLACCAAWLFVARLLGPPTATTPDPRGTTAWLAALLFAVHPAHGESVAWLAAAFNDPPAAVAILLGLTAHGSWLRGGRTRHLAAGLVAYAVALLLKESSLSMLLLVPLVELFSRGRTTRRAIAIDPRRTLLGVAPYAVLTAVYFVVRRVAIGTSFGVYADGGTWLDVLPTLPSLALVYIRLLVWPWHLSPAYPFRRVDGWSDPAVWIALGAWVLLLAAVWLLLRALARRPATRELVPWLLFGLGWTAACVWPVFNIRSFRPSYLVHQRYLYLAVLGLCVALAVWATRVGRRRAARVAGLVVLLAVWTASLLVHNRHWASDEALWTRVAAVDPANPASFDWLGARALAGGRVDEAESLFRRAIEADPSSPFGHRNLAVLLHQHRRRPTEALPPYRAALRAFESRPDQRREATEAAVGYGVALAESGDADGALAVLLPIAEAPTDESTSQITAARAVRNAAVLLRRTGRHARLVALLDDAVLRHPDDPVLRAMRDDVHAAARRAPADRLHDEPAP